MFVRSFPVFDGEEITTLKESARVYAQALALEARVVKAIEDLLR